MAERSFECLLPKNSPMDWHKYKLDDLYSTLGMCLRGNPMLTVRFDSEKAIEAILYIASKAPIPDLYHVGKIIYFADRLHLERYGRLITNDRYIAMKNGPVASNTYDIIKGVRGDGRFSGCCDLSHARASFSVGSLGDPNAITPKRHVDEDIFSDSDIACIEQAIAEYGSMSFGQLNDISHDEVWMSADLNNEIPLETIAKNCKDSELLLSYLSGREC